MRNRVLVGLLAVVMFASVKASALKSSDSYGYCEPCWFEVNARRSLEREATGQDPRQGTSAFECAEALIPEGDRLKDTPELHAIRVNCLMSKDRDGYVWSVLYSRHKSFIWGTVAFVALVIFVAFGIWFRLPRKSTSVAGLVIALSLASSSALAYDGTGKNDAHNALVFGLEVLVGLGLIVFVCVIFFVAFFRFLDYLSRLDRKDAEASLRKES